MSKTLSEYLFEHCHFDNPVFLHGLFWSAVFFVSLAGTLYYRHVEAMEALEEKR